MNLRLAAWLAAGLISGCPGVTAASTAVFINEIHYDNAGADVGEVVEVAGPAGTDLGGWMLQPYNGADAQPYAAISLGGVIGDSGGGFGVLVFPIPGLQNGSPDGIALIDAAGRVVQFLSYEGRFAAAGIASVDIGVFEAGDSPPGTSLQLRGTGTTYEDFTWAAGATATPGAVNHGQAFAATPRAGAGGLTPIYALQGSQRVSPFVGRFIRTRGVVTADFQDGAGADGNLRGFFLQDRAGDGDAATADGIFVFQPKTTLDVQRGDLVEVAGEVVEYFGLTEVVADEVTRLAAGADLPAPVTVTLPTAATARNADGEPIADLERYEGMLIVLPQTLTVTELFNLDRFGEVLLAAGGRFYQFTQRQAPSASGYAAHREELARRSLMLDDGLFEQNPDPIRYPAPGLGPANPLRAGDTVTGLTGVLGYSRGAGDQGAEAYRLHPLAEPRFAAGNPRPADPGVPGPLRVASFNVQNYFTTIDGPGAACFPSNTRADCRGADSRQELGRQRARLVAAIGGLGADVVGLTELENNHAPGRGSAIADLAGALTAAGRGCGRWAWVDPGRRVGDDAIAVGILYCAERVALAPGTRPAVLSDAELPGLGLAGGVFDGPATSRAPLAASFVARSGGEGFTLAVAHFKSKGPGPLAGRCATAADRARVPDCDQGDGQSFWNDRRVRAAKALSLWLASAPTGSVDPDVLVVGDLNSYRREDPVALLVGDGYEDLRDDPRAYSFVFDGQAGSLDHALASRSLAAQVTGAGEWHANADEADALDYNLEFGRDAALFDGTSPYRASDHDPIVVGLRLTPDAGPTPTAALLVRLGASADSDGAAACRTLLIRAEREYRAGRLSGACEALAGACRQTGPRPRIEAVAREIGCP